MRLPNRPLVIVFAASSYIRGTMVKLLATPANTRQPGAVLCDGAGVAYLDTTPAEDACGNVLRNMEPSTCTFWCAIALGALAKGSPNQSVSRERARKRVFVCTTGFTTGFFHVRPAGTRISPGPFMQLPSF